MMTDLTKSAMSCGIAMSLYGMQQMAHLLNPMNYGKLMGPLAGPGMSPGPSGSASPLAMLGPADPFLWMGLGAQIMQQMMQQMSGGMPGMMPPSQHLPPPSSVPAMPLPAPPAMPSVLDYHPAPANAPYPPVGAFQSVPPPRPATGWGPMP